MTVLKENGTYRRVKFPNDARVQAAQEAYVGGHVYTVTPAVATALAAAGYTTVADPVVASPVLVPSESLAPSTSLVPQG